MIVLAREKGKLVSMLEDCGQSVGLREHLGGALRRHKKKVSFRGERGKGTMRAP